MRHTADHVVLANGADPPVPGLRELDGVWSNRAVTSMKAIPRRLLILSGGSVGVSQMNETGPSQIGGTPQSANTNPDYNSPPDHDPTYGQDH